PPPGPPPALPAGRGRHTRVRGRRGPVLQLRGLWVLGTLLVLLRRALGGHGATGTEACAGHAARRGARGAACGQAAARRARLAATARHVAAPRAAAAAPLGVTACAAFVVLSPPRVG